MPLWNEAVNDPMNVEAEGMAKQPGKIVFPPCESSWLSPKRVNYVKDVIEMLVYMIALPWLMFHFFTNPLRTIRVVGEAKVG